MEGPTPVSALIHAATMVTAGVFMVCRLSPMFEAAPAALGFVTVIGAATCFFAATIGTTQWDIKRVIAYSTCSQLGYMFFAAGVGAYGAAMFHLFTHAFFKALLFLGAGSVIHAMHHEQDMRYYGGLRKEIPFTFWAMLAGTLAITGVGVYRCAGFAGFWSKDAILEVGLCRRTASCSYTAFWLGTHCRAADQFLQLAADVPDLLGQAPLDQSEHIQHAVHETPRSGGRRSPLAGYHPHESPWSMLVPLGLLSLGAVAAGWLFSHAFLESEASGPGSIAYNEHLMHAMHEVPMLVKYAAIIVMVLGLLGAIYAYLIRARCPGEGGRAARADPHLRLPQVDVRRALPLPLHRPRLLARPPVLEAGRRRHHQPVRSRWRGLGGDAGFGIAKRFQSGYLTELRAGHAARPCRRDHLGACSDGRISRSFPSCCGAHAGRDRLPVPAARRPRDWWRWWRHWSIWRSAWCCGRISTSAARSGSSQECAR